MIHVLLAIIRAILSLSFIPRRYNSMTSHPYWLHIPFLQVFFTTNACFKKHHPIIQPPITVFLSIQSSCNCRRCRKVFNVYLDKCCAISLVGKDVNSKMSRLAHHFRVFNLSCPNSWRALCCSSCYTMSESMPSCWNRSYYTVSDTHLIQHTKNLKMFPWICLTTTLTKKWTRINRPTTLL